MAQNGAMSANKSGSSSVLSLSSFLAEIHLQ